MRPYQLTFPVNKRKEDAHSQSFPGNKQAAPLGVQVAPVSFDCPGSAKEKEFFCVSEATVNVLFAPSESHLNRKTKTLDCLRLLSSLLFYLFCYRCGLSLWGRSADATERYRKYYGNVGLEWRWRWGGLN